MSPDWSAKVEPVPYAKLGDPQSLNLYGYVLNNPLSSVDADGHVSDGSTANNWYQSTYEEDWRSLVNWQAASQGSNPLDGQTLLELAQADQMMFLAKMDAAFAQPATAHRKNGKQLPGIVIQTVQVHGKEEGCNMSDLGCQLEYNQVMSASINYRNLKVAPRTWAKVKIGAEFAAAMFYYTEVPTCSHLMKRGVATGMVGAGIGVWGLLAGPLATDVEVGGKLLQYAGTFEAGIGKLGIGCRN
jgi:hypothetical protein